MVSMRPHPSPAPIRPKISTMPRPKTEAAAYLDIYKLVTEKKRLEQELELLDQRRSLITQRLEALNHQVSHLEIAAHDLRAESPDSSKVMAQPKAVAQPLHLSLIHI